MKLAIEIDTNDSQLVFQLFETSTFPSGQVIRLADELTIAFEEEEFAKSAKHSKKIRLILSIGATLALGVASSLAANWLNDKLKPNDVILRIDRTVVEVENGKIKKIIEEKIQLQDK